MRPHGTGLGDAGAPGALYWLLLIGGVGLGAYGLVKQSPLLAVAGAAAAVVGWRNRS